MEIKEQNVVTLTYTLALDSGEVVDKATEEKPFAFIHGIGMTLPAFDAALKGKKNGDEFSFSLTAEEGYGVYNDQMIQKLDKAIFAEAPEGTLELGKTLPMQVGDPSNPQAVQTVFGTISEITDDKVTMDFNHPLAGKGLNFSGTILEVREATKSELDHGHVHGAHGHQH